MNHNYNNPNNPTPMYTDPAYHQMNQQQQHYPQQHQQNIVHDPSMMNTAYMNQDYSHIQQDVYQNQVMSPHYTQDPNSMHTYQMQGGNLQQSSMVSSTSTTNASTTTTTKRKSQAKPRKAKAAAAAAAAAAANNPNSTVTNSFNSNINTNVDGYGGSQMTSSMIGHNIQSPHMYHSSVSTTGQSIGADGRPIGQYTPVSTMSSNTNPYTTNTQPGSGISVSGMSYSSNTSASIPANASSGSMGGGTVGSNVGTSTGIKTNSGYSSMSNIGSKVDSHDSIHGAQAQPTPIPSSTTTSTSTSKKEKEEDEDMFNKPLIRKIFSGNIPPKSIYGHTSSSQSKLTEAVLTGISKILIQDIIQEAKIVKKRQYGCISTDINDDGIETEERVLHTVDDVALDTYHIHEAIRRLRKKKKLFPFSDSQFTLGK